MAAELDALTPEQTAVVSAAAVLGGPFRPEDVSRRSQGSDSPASWTRWTSWCAPT